MAEWLCSGLQSRGRRFDSDLSLHYLNVSEYHLQDKHGYNTARSLDARVAKLVDARDLKIEHPVWETTGVNGVKFGEPSVRNGSGNPELSLQAAGKCRDLTAPA